MAYHAGFDPSEVYVYRGWGSIPLNVRRVEVHRSVKFIPDRLFYGCDQLESVLLHEGLLKIGEWAFRGCSSLIIIQIPSTVTNIGWGAFSRCSNLAAVELSEGLESIEDSTFYKCTSLEEMQIPASVARIGVEAFAHCTNLASVGLCEGLRLIGDCAFADCTSLESLWVPLSVIEIGKEAISRCSSLSSIWLPEELPRMRRFAFRGCPLVSFRFVHLSQRMEAMRMDGQIKSMFNRRLREITLALNRDRPFSNEEAANAVWEKCKESLGRAHKVLAYLELKGAAPVLEHALWKAKIGGRGEVDMQADHVNNEDGGQDLSDAGRDRKRPKVTKNIGQDTRLSRDDCRVKCGAGIVIPEVLKFLAYSSSWPRLDDSEEGNID